MQNILEDIKAFFAVSPAYAYLLVGLVSLVLFVGIVRNKNWAVDPANASQRLLYNWFGRTAFRVVAGMVFLLGAIAGFAMFFYLKQ